MDASLHGSHHVRPSASRYTLPRAASLKRRRLIRALFDRSRTDVGSLATGTVRLIYRVAASDELEADAPVQIGFAPGRRARRATERNRIKRHMREVYRLHQQPLVDLFSRRPGTLTVMVLYRGAADQFGRIPQDLPRALARLVRELEQSLPPASSTAPEGP